MGKIKANEQFVAEAIMEHGDKYDYSLSEYVSAKKKVKIICPIHGIFEQTPSNHLSGQGCPQCSKERRANTRLIPKDEFINRFRSSHGSKYDYSKVEYKGNDVPVCIICPIHGEFWQRPHYHSKGGECPNCAREKSKKIVRGVGINDYPYPIKVNGENIQSYHIWQEMLSRCYKNDSKTHSSCSVCDEWLYFSKFKEWFDEHYVEGWHLDKDILVKGNKVYSPQTCCFVPPVLNVIVKGTQFKKEMCGVSKYNGGYKCEITKRGKHYTFYKFRTPEQAFEKYKYEREKYIHELAEEWKDQIEPRVYEALMNYKIEITY